jgi:predicted aldo/keto reductase-like oxidoreductase
VEAAIRFLLAHPEITVTLVGYGTNEHVKESIQAVEGYREISRQALQKIKDAAGSKFEGLCTGCQYCDDCPESIPIPKLMEAYNQKLLRKSDKSLLDQLGMHWGISPDEAARCIECGQCEDACTQHLDIMNRLKDIVAIATAAK